jgi:hypothetical protein
VDWRECLEGNTEIPAFQKCKYASCCGLLVMVGPMVFDTGSPLVLRITNETLADIFLNMDWIDEYWDTSKRVCVIDDDPIARRWVGILDRDPLPWVLIQQPSGML